jgi:hypothetical protein
VARFLRAAVMVWGVLLLALTMTQVVDLQHGDAARGELLYTGQGNPRLPCRVCHFNRAIAPPMHSISERVAQVRLTVAENGAKSVIGYLVESILEPGRYVVPGYTNAMVANFSETLSVQDVQDIVAYLMTL